MTDEYFPPRQKSLILNGLAAFVLVLLILGMLIIGSMTRQNTLAILLMAAGILLLLPLFLVIYRIFVVLSTVYLLSRDALEISWGLRRELLPIGQIDWVNPVSEFETQLPLGVTFLKSAYYGEKRINGLGQTLFVATSPEQMVLIKRGNQYLVISPENARIFCERFDQINQLGSLKQFEPESENLTMLWQRVWADRWAKRMLIAGIISLALLLIAAMTIGLSREQIVWVSMERVPASRALLLALIGTLFGLINTFVGLLLYLQDRVAANVRNLIWGWTILVNAIFTIALILMAV
ncbi:MAG: hypothetical protein GX797_09735 [Chloroflexi bacterium]|jgi:hypothetical protein|nr:hypothetical protein [Chloroflexota bacterium]